MTVWTDKDGIEHPTWHVFGGLAWIIGVIVVWSAGWIILQEVGEYLF